MRRASLSPEGRLLFLAATATPSDAALRQALHGGIDWNELAALARHERAASVVLREVVRVGTDPRTAGYLKLRQDATASKLRQDATASVMQMLQLEQLLWQAVDLLAEQKIETLLLKGAGLAYTAYGSFADRPMSDIDLLLPSRDSQRAWSLLQARGWTSTVAQEDAEKLRGHHHLPRLTKEPGSFMLEIHDALLPAEHPFNFPIDAIWAGARKVAVKGRVLTVPQPIHQLWHACVHFAWSHRMEWGSWRTFRDVAAIVHRGQIDWTEFVALARDSRAATCCFWTLKLARRLTGATVPDAVLASLSPPYPDFVIRRLERHLVVNLLASDDRCPSVWLGRKLWETAIAPRWSGHGTSRPWDVSERWLAGSLRNPQEREVDSLPVRIRKAIAGAAYLFRVSRQPIPLDLA
jgi:hypothetical protein